MLKNPLEKLKEEYHDTIKVIGTETGLGIDPQYTHAIIIEFLKQIHQRLDYLEKELTENRSRSNKISNPAHTHAGGKNEEARMKNSWLIWVFIVGIAITALIAFNYYSEKSKVPLSEIFSEEETFPVDVEYEFVEGEKQGVQVSTAVPTPAVQQMAKVEESKITTTPSAAPATPTQITEQSLKPAPQAVSQEVSQTEYNKIPFTIQVASFKDKVHAEKLTEELKNKGFSGYWLARNLGEKGTWYRVYVGNFDSKQQAEELLTKVKNEYTSSFIISPKR